MRTLASGQAARLSIWISRVRIPSSLPESRSSNGSGHESTELEIPVRIRSGIPSLGASSSGQDGALSMPRRGSIPLAPANAFCWSGVTAATLVLEASAYGRESSNLSSSTISRGAPGRAASLQNWRTVFESLPRRHITSTTLYLLIFSDEDNDDGLPLPTLSPRPGDSSPGVPGRLRAPSRLRCRIRVLHRRPRSLLGLYRRGTRMVPPLGPGLRMDLPHLPLVSRRSLQYHAQLPGPPRPGRPRRPSRLPLDQRGRRRSEHHLHPASRTSLPPGQRPPLSRRLQRRPRHRLPASLH